MFKENRCNTNTLNYKCIAIMSTRYYVKAYGMYDEIQQGTLLCGCRGYKQQMLYLGQKRNHKRRLCGF